MASSPGFARVATGLGASVLLAAALHVALGGVIQATPAHWVHAFLAGPTGAGQISSVLWDIRLPRVAVCLLVGAILGSVGGAFQFLLRNPLADPFVMGVSGGAAVGGTMVVGAGLAGLALELGPLVGAVVGGLGALGLVLALAGRVASTEQLLLGGVVMGLALSGLMTLGLLLRGQDTSSVVRWLLGATTPAYWSRAVVLLSVAALGGWALLRDLKHLNALALGEESAAALGTDVRAVSRRVLGIGTVTTSLAVGAAGLIGFVGLVAPHLSRRIVGVDARRSVPTAAAVGAILLLIADLLAQRLAPGQELPVGAVTAVLGAPALYFLLRKGGSP